MVAIMLGLARGVASTCMSGMQDRGVVSTLKALPPRKTMSCVGL